MFSVPSNCGRCDELVDFRFEVVFDHTQRTPEEVKALRDIKRGDVNRHSISIQTLRNEDQISASALSHCPRCYGPSLIVFRTTRIAFEGIKNIVKAGEGALLGGSSLVNVLEVHPKPREPQTNPHWPAEITRQFSEAQRFVSQKVTPSIIISVCRTVLDVATKRLGAPESETLYKRIEFLASQGTITSPIKDWAHELRLDGNSATHDAIGDEQQASEYVEFLKMLLNMTFTLPATINAKRTVKT